MEYIVSKEGLGYSIKGKLDERNSDTLKAVVRQHWKEKLTEVEKSKGKHIAAELETHLSNMNAILDPIDYEAFCVPNIIQHSKHMQKEDFSNYLKLIESMAIGYSAHLGKDLTSLILIGVTSKGRSVGSAERYLGLLLKNINGRMTFYQNHINMKSRRVTIMSSRLKAHQGSILRFLRKKKINRLTNKIMLTNSELQVLNGKVAKYNTLLATINSTRTKPPQKPPSN